MAPLGTALQVTHCDSLCGVRQQALTKDLVPFIYIDGIWQGLTKGELSHHVK